MNCATHSDTAAVAFCRTCGKPLCNQCTRDVRGVIYCEACLAARMEGTAPAPGFVPPAADNLSADRNRLRRWPRPPVSSGPNPAVAGILAGFFPIGVGAVYTGQYAKGLSHLVIMVLLILGVSSDLPWYVITGLGHRDRIFLRLPDHRLRFAAQRRFRWENRPPIPSDWRKRSAPARNLKEPRFPPELPFSSAWACSFCCTPQDCLSSAWIVSGR